MSVFIGLTEAAEMTRDFKNNRNVILGAGYQNLDLLPINETFTSSQVISMLNNPGCVGLRVYYGMDADKKLHAILVGVDGEDKDILPENDDPGNYILERGIRNPPTPTPSSPLNP